MAEIASLPEAVSELIDDGDAVALEGFSHLVPFAAGHEIIRQGATGLTLIRMVPELIGDQLIGMGRLRRLVFAWAGNPGVGSLHRFRDAVENEWPGPIELEEHSHAGMANRFAAGAAGLPFGILRGYAGTDLLQHTDGVASVQCPFTGERLAAVEALRPDVAVIHAQRADWAGNVQLWGVTGVQVEAVLASGRSLVTVEELVDELTPVAGAVLIPSWAVSLIAVAPGGSYPGYAAGYSVRDNDFYFAWDSISRDRDRFKAWVEEHVLDADAPGGRERTRSR